MVDYTINLKNILQFNKKYVSIYIKKYKNRPAIKCQYKIKNKFYTNIVA